MKRLLICILLFAIGPASAQVEDWKRYENQDGNFSILFPAEPKDTVTGSDPTVTAHTIVAVQNKTAYAVVYVNMADEQKVDEATYQQFRDGVLRQLPKCQVQKEVVPKPALVNYIGHGYQMACDTTMLSGNFYWGKRHAYAVFAVYLASVPEPKEAGRFLESFALLDAAK